LLGGKPHYSTTSPHLFDTWLFIALEAIDAGLKNLTVRNFSLPAFTEWHNVIVLMT